MHLEAAPPCMLTHTYAYVHVNDFGYIGARSYALRVGGTLTCGTSASYVSVLVLRMRLTPLRARLTLLRPYRRGATYD